MSICQVRILTKKHSKEKEGLFIMLLAKLTMEIYIRFIAQRSTFVK